MGDVEIILSDDSSNDTIIIDTPNKLCTKNVKFEYADSDIEDIVKKYISENGETEFEDNYNSENKLKENNDDDMPPVKKSKESTIIQNLKFVYASSSQDDSFNEIDALKTISEKYKNFLDNNSPETGNKVNIIDDKPLGVKGRKECDNVPPIEELLKGSTNAKDKSVSDSSSSQDDSLIEIDTLKALSDKYKLFKNNSTPKESIENDNKTFNTKEKKKQEKELQKQLKNEERERKKLEKEREKSIKQALAATNKNVKPEECMKFIQAQIDTSIINEEYGKDIISALQATEVTYNVETQIFPFTISWIRKTQSHCLNDDGKLILSSEDQATDEILLIMNCKEFVEHVSNKTLTSHVQSLQTVLLNKKINLAIFGLDSYFRYQSIQKQKEFKAQVSNGNPKTSKDNKFFKDFPQVSRENIEFALTEVQVFCKCSHRIIYSAAEIGAIVVQFTKSIAQLPYKLQKQEKHQQTEWYASGDGKDSVKIDKDGNGLARLWKQMLTTFPLASLETAEAISSKYPTMTALMDAYENCTSEAELLLQDIPIRRAAGPISSARRIGPELSRKVYKFFNSSDGDTLL